MVLRFVLIAWLVSIPGAWAAEGAPARAPLAPRAPSAPPARLVRLRTVEVGKDVLESTDTTLSVPARSRLALENLSGDIVVAGWDRDAVRVQAQHRSHTRIDVDVRPATVVVRAVRRVRLPALGGPRQALFEEIEIPTAVEYRLTVPRWMSLGLSGVNSSISVAGVEGDVTAEVVNGSVMVRGGRGSIRVGSINGEVEAIGARGSVEASSVNEGVTLRNVEGPVRVESVDGDVELFGIVSDAVEASTVSGDLRYDGTLRAGGSYRFESHSGDVTVAVPDRPDVAVAVDTYKGGFASSFPVQSRSTLSAVKGRGKEFNFTLGDGRAEMSLQSFSGLIRLARTGEPAGQVRVVYIRREP